jgi:hypothetical protein
MQRGVSCTHWLMLSLKGSGNASSRCMLQQMGAWMLRFGIAVTALCLSLGSALAAPAGLLNKTVHISFARSIPNIGSDGKSENTPRLFYMTLYVSGAGRIFSKIALRPAPMAKTANLIRTKPTAPFRFRVHS